MQSLNVLVVSEKYSVVVESIKNSKFLNKLYVTFPIETEGIFSISFNTFQELAQKCKTLQIDFVIVIEEKWILQGIGDVMKKNHINCFAPTSFWTNLELSNDFARNLLEKYSINIPEKINLPVEFPVVVRSNGYAKRADSIQDVINIKRDIYNHSPEIAQTVYIEKFLDGKKEFVVSLFDGKNLAVFDNKNLDQDCVIEYSRKLKEMLIKEKADFIGFINSEVILNEDKLYNIGFNFNFYFPGIEKDLLFILQLAIYQKLNEFNCSK